MASYVAGGMKLLKGVTGLVIIGAIAALFVAGAAPADYIGPALGSVALALGVGFLETALS